MKRDNYILIVFFTLILLALVKTASLSYDPRLMGMLAILFFVAILTIAAKM